MRQQEFFETVIRGLEELRIPYMVTGSVGAMLYGEPRLTNDMDVVVRLDEKRVEPLLARFRAPEYCSPPPEVVREEIRRRGQFNVIHIASGSKVDLIIRKDDPFAREEFGRRRPSAFTESMDCRTATPEDIIIAKLMSYREGASEKHLRDIRGMLEVSGEAVDQAYLTRWIDRLGLNDAWSLVSGQ